MQTEGVCLHVKIGGPALKLNEIALLKEKINAAQSAILQAEESLVQARPAHLTGNKKTCSYENEVIQFAALKRQGMDLYYACEDFFCTYLGSRDYIIDEELAARHLLIDIHQEFYRDMAEKKNREHIYSTTYAYQRLSLHELCVQEKVKMAQEHSDHLLSLKFAEKEARFASINLALQKQWRENPWPFAAPQNVGNPQGMPLPQQSLPAPARYPAAPGEQAYPLPQEQYAPPSWFQGPQAAFQLPPDARVYYQSGYYNPL